MSWVERREQGVGEREREATRGEVLFRTMNEEEGEGERESTKSENEREEGSFTTAASNTSRGM